LQLVVSEEVVTEYVVLLQRLRIPPKRGEAFRQRLRRQDIITHVNLGPRFTKSRDPDDNMLLAAAAVGKTRFLVTNDRDLLDIPATQRREFRFEIVTPQELLTRVTEVRKR
jgi:putative PIN family toxin of toxin-antitoxin system